jgi:hypothetical protein
VEGVRVEREGGWREGEGGGSEGGEREGGGRVRAEGGMGDEFFYCGDNSATHTI